MVDDLYLLAFDHRRSLRMALAGAGLDPSLRLAVKHIVADAFARCWSGGTSSMGVLVDAEIGSPVARRALENDWTRALALERSGRRVLELPDPAEIRATLERYRPHYGKVLVRYHPDDAPEVRRAQLDGLATAAALCASREVSLMVELLVPPSEADLAACAGSRERFDSERRPTLTVCALQDIGAAGVRPTVWKLEGFGSEARCREIAAAATEAAPGSRVLTLGRGADLETVRRWVRVGAGVAAYAGFAVGRTLWLEPIIHHLAGGGDRETAVREISTRFRALVDAFRRARERAR